MVMDNNADNSSSKVAAGIINPVTGRRYVTAWMIDELLDFTPMAYKEFGDYLNTPLLFQKSIIDFFPSAQMRNAFVDRVTENDTYLHAYPDQNSFNPYFHYDYGCGEISPAYIVDVQAMLTAWRSRLAGMNAVLEESFVPSALTIADDHIRYHNIIARKIIFCDGIAAAENPWFLLLPFSANKGEALIIECEDLNTKHVFKKGMFLAPLLTENTYWLGSNYQWEFEDAAPSEKFYKGATDLLNNWLKKPYKVLSHKAAVRPATLERRPFVGLHPHAQQVGILNGMGTKGTSLAPFFAYQLSQQLVYNLPITPEADIQRFNRILSK